MCSVVEAIYFSPPADKLQSLPLRETNYLILPDFRMLDLRKTFNYMFTGTRLRSGHKPSIYFSAQAMAHQAVLLVSENLAD